jgi:hypothetical protein
MKAEHAAEGSAAAEDSEAADDSESGAVGLKAMEMDEKPKERKRRNTKPKQPAAPMQHDAASAAKPRRKKSAAATGNSATAVAGDSAASQQPASAPSVPGGMSTADPRLVDSSTGALIGAVDRLIGALSASASRASPAAAAQPSASHPSAPLGPASSPAYGAPQLQSFMPQPQEPMQQHHAVSATQTHHGAPQPGCVDFHFANTAPTPHTPPPHRFPPPPNPHHNPFQVHGVAPMDACRCPSDACMQCEAQISPYCCYGCGAARGHNVSHGFGH